MVQHKLLPSVIKVFVLGIEELLTIPKVQDDEDQLHSLTTYPNQQNVLPLKDIFFSFFLNLAAKGLKSLGGMACGQNPQSG